MNDLYNNERIAALVYKYLLQQLSEEEQQELDQWLAASPANQAQFEEMSHRARLQGKFEKYNDVNTEGIWQKITNKLPEVNTIIVAKPRHGWWTRFAIAASVMTVVAAGGWYYLSLHGKKGTNEPLVNTQHKNDVAPGGNKAVLTLANGTTNILDNAEKGTIAQEGGTAINKTQEGQLVYNAKKGHTNSVKEALSYNTVSTPRGGQYHIILPDGSNVWLNAASSIRFPTKFIGDERKVAVDGEAYFEVAKDKAKPFIVSITPPPGGIGGAIQVLGTHFNVNAYTDEENLNTTLLEGSIKFTPHFKSGNAASKILAPGQQAIVYKDAEKLNVINNEDAQSQIAWVKGVFHFEKADISQVMRQLSRWYDVQIEYEGNLPHQTITGDVERNIPLSELLSALEQMGKMHYKIEGKTVKVIP